MQTSLELQRNSAKNRPKNHAQNRFVRIGPRGSGRSGESKKTFHLYDFNICIQGSESAKLMLKEHEIKEIRLQSTDAFDFLTNIVNYLLDLAAKQGTDVTSCRALLTVTHTFFDYLNAYNCLKAILNIR